MRLKAARTKLSTTVSPETFRYLNALVKSGRARNLAEALDTAIGNVRRAENRRRLAKATAEYYESLSPTELASENALSQAMSAASSKVDFDHEL